MIFDWRFCERMKVTRSEMEARVLSFLATLWLPMFCFSIWGIPARLRQRAAGQSAVKLQNTVPSADVGTPEGLDIFFFDFFLYFVLFFFFFFWLLRQVPQGAPRLACTASSV